MGRWDYYGYFKPSIPREARGGIKAQSKRGRFGGTWWARRWVSVLEGFNIGPRLGRGRAYARRGQVLSIDIGKGKVSAMVQGSRSRPYSVKIRVKTLSTGDWRKLAKGFSHQPIFVAKLLSGEMPQDIEIAFQDTGLSLFPNRIKDLETGCSCPDWSNPCKHIAAVYYLLGEEFDRDPFLIFKLRGMSREELVELLGRSGKDSTPKKVPGESAAPKPEKESPPPIEPLPLDAPAFWGETDVGKDLLGEVRIPPVSAALPKRLGNFSFWRSEEMFMEAMEQIYHLASPLGMDVFLGEWGTKKAE